MATISSPGVGTNGLDVKSIISQLVALEKKPLDTLKLQASTVSTKISAFGQIKSLVSTLSDSTSKLTSVTGWNAVTVASSDSKYVTASALGGTLPTTFSVEVQALAKAQATASAAILPRGSAIGAGTLRIEIGKWAASPAMFTATSGSAPVDITVSASDTITDVASKINGSSAGVTATVLTDATGDRLLLRSKSTGEDFGFRLGAMEAGDTDIASATNTDASGLSRLVAGATVTQAAANARATVNGIPVSSASNTFATTVSGVTFKAEQVTTAAVEINVTKDNSSIQSNIDGFVKAYNAINQLLQEATKFDPATKAGGLLQGDSTAINLQNTLRAAIQATTSGGGGFTRLADVGITQQRGGDLVVDSAKLGKAISDSPEDLKNLFRSTAGGSADGIAVKIKTALTNLLSVTGFFGSKDASLQLSLKQNAKDQTTLGTKVDAFEKRITARYNALDSQLTKLNGINAYVAQQVTAWNKTTS
ncbi:flagellar filament capping protein FliD [Rhodoferax sp. TBRC 17198]|uniref:flagellar filament capping protein FliD n=1 Tax=Rhodoferax potami TaxID=3068338 RepID=UPI0028BDFC27|nr:flagellar filament capping protein FliD [Rhodoferax sp. TBRC 17198]MDT7524359.1 flagellar filament capping protein FliD [Rhodoferax sp. TBRC 17198]